MRTGTPPPKSGPALWPPVRDARLYILSKAIALAACGRGLFLNLGLQFGRFYPAQLRYYTLQSLLWCFVFLGCALGACLVFWHRQGAGGGLSSGGSHSGVRHSSGQQPGIRPFAFAPRLHGGVVAAIAFTLLVYQLVLAPRPFYIGPNVSAANRTAHLAAPLLVLADWLLFTPRGRLRPTDPLRWTALPLGYYIYVLGAAAAGATYQHGARWPYPFLDADKLGWPAVGGHLAVLLAAFLAIGYTLYGLDRALFALGVKAGQQRPVPPNKKAHDTGESAA